MGSARIGSEAYNKVLPGKIQTFVFDARHAYHQRGGSTRQFPVADV